MKKLLVAILIGFGLIGQCIAQQVETGTMRGIPFVRTGDEIVIVNDQPNVQTIRISFHTAVMTLVLQPLEIRRLRSPETGYALVESDKTDFTAYSIVDNAVFAAQLLNTYSRGFVVTKQTGIAISNPQNISVTLTFWLYTHDGYSTYKNFALLPGNSMIGFFNDIIGVVDTQLWVKVLASKPIFIGAAECSKVCQSIPIRNYGVLELGPVQNSVPLSHLGSER